MNKPLETQLTQIQNFFGIASFQKGLRYYYDDRVHTISIEADTVRGLVQGSERLPYKVTLTYRGSTLVDGHCACPVSYRCKHTAAVAIHICYEHPFKNEPGNAELPRAAEDWSKTLENLLPADEPDAPNKIGELHLVFRLSERPYYQQRSEVSAQRWELQIRPRVFYPQENSLSLKAVRWQRYISTYSKSMFPCLSEEQGLFFSQLSAAMMIGDIFQNSLPWASVEDGTAMAVWHILSRHKDYHVNLFFGDKSHTPQSFQGDVLTTKIRITDHQGGVRLTSDIFLQGLPVKTPVIMVGDPAVFGVCAEASPSTPTTPFTPQIQAIHPAKIAHSKTFLSLRSKPMDIPKMEVPSFVSRWLGELVKNFEIDNQSLAIVLPRRSTLKALLSVHGTAEGFIRFTIEWKYSDQAVSLFPSADEAWSPLKNTGIRRAPQEETRIRRVLEEAVQTFDPVWQVHLRQGTRQLRSETLLRGAEAIELITRILPTLEAHPDILIQNDITSQNLSAEELIPQADFHIDDDTHKTDWFDLRIEISVGQHKVPLRNILPALAAGEDSFFLPDGKYFSLNTPFFDDLRALIKQAEALLDSKQGVFKLTRFQAGWWDELQKMGIIKNQSARWQSAIEGLTQVSSPAILPTPKTFAGDLRDYQSYGYSWMSFLRQSKLGGVLADDMGLGKTIQALAFIAGAYERLMPREKNKPFLIVAPTSVVENWSSELEKFTPSLKKIVFRRGDRSISLAKMEHAQVVVTSFALLMRDESHFSEILWDTVIVDEAQFVKNRYSKAYASLRRLQSDSKIALTGTPMENNLMELWSVFSIGAPGLFPSPEKFRLVFQKPIEKEGRSENLPLLRAYLKPFLLRRTKDKVERQLPPKTEQTLSIPMDTKQRQIYDIYLQRERQRVLGLLREGGLKKNRFEILTSLTRLRQLCLHASLVDAKNKAVPSAKIEALVEHLRTILEEDHKVLVFSQFTSFLSIVQKRLTKEKIRFSYLDGATADRKKVLDEFTQDKNIPVFLISLKAGGVGLNLTCADYCILLDPWWNPAVENQAIDRTHRIGQKNHVMVYRLIAQDSIEEKVLKLQEKKKVLFKNVLEDGEIFSNIVTEEDIQNIFNLPKIS